ncbi:MAG: hypothetical protein AUJ07_08260 [Crenarchaeota archaeon 13_1_40CM_3_53_5]|nr:MAG: hypothetical protein AUJ07_08260 [Crenarchaeota archaeon 13_1_40CM_3_53_5]
MKNSFFFIFLTPLLLLPIAFATSSSSGSGTYSASSTPTSVRTQNGNTIIDSNVVFTIAGTISGTCTGTERDVVHPNGIVTFRGACTFSGTFAGASGTGLKTARADSMTGRLAEPSPPFPTK